MKKNFEVIITEQLTRRVVIEADNIAEAEALVEQQYTNCEIVLDTSDFDGVEIQGKKIDED